MPLTSEFRAVHTPLFIALPRQFFTTCGYMKKTQRSFPDLFYAKKTLSECYSAKQAFFRDIVSPFKQSWDNLVRYFFQPAIDVDDIAMLLSSGLMLSLFVLCSVVSVVSEVSVLWALSVILLEVELSFIISWMFFPILVEVLATLIGVVGGMMYAGFGIYDYFLEEDADAYQLDLYKSKELLIDAGLRTLMSIFFLVLFPLTFVIEFVRHITRTMSSLIHCAGVEIFDEDEYPYHLSPI